MSKKLSIEKLWSYVCNGKIDKVKEYYKQGWNKNTRYDAFKIHHSLIAGAFRNKQHEIVDYLLSEGETITPDEITEILHCLSLVNDYVPLLENLKIKQLCIIANVIAMYENDELIVCIDDYETTIDYANKPDEMFPYKTIITWYEGLTDTEDLIDFMNYIDH